MIGTADAPPQDAPPQVESRPAWADEIERVREVVGEVHDHAEEYDQYQITGERYQRAALLYEEYVLSGEAECPAIFNILRKDADERTEERAIAEPLFGARAGIRDRAIRGIADTIIRKEVEQLAFEVNMDGYTPPTKQLTCKIAEQVGNQFEISERMKKYDLDLTGIIAIEDLEKIYFAYYSGAMLLGFGEEEVTNPDLGDLALSIYALGVLHRTMSVGGIVRSGESRDTVTPEMLAPRGGFQVPFDLIMCLHAYPERVKPLLEQYRDEELVSRQEFRSWDIFLSQHKDSASAAMALGEAVQGIVLTDPDIDRFGELGVDAFEIREDVQEIVRGIVDDSMHEHGWKRT